jgi:DNA polymerase lambda
MSKPFLILTVMWMMKSVNRLQNLFSRYYEEIKEKIPRSEVESISGIVEKAAKELEPGVWLETCGSYRRGKSSCGDIDVVLSLQDDSKLDQFLQQLILKLKECNCITDDLSSGQSHKFLGICQATPTGLHRRLDLFVVLWGERGCALVHYTGSAHFNRSLRRLALKKNWTLSDHALTGDAGQIIPTSCEKDVFDALGVEFRPPSQREHALEVL